MISGSAIGNRKTYSFVTFTYAKLLSQQITPTDILKENKALFQQGDTCAYCDANSNLQWEHIIPLAKGGPDTFDNLVRACQSCNLTKATKDPYQWYADGRIDAIPRVVLGKLLKLVFAAYSEAGVVDSEDYMTDQKIERVSLTQIFARNEAAKLHASQRQVSDPQ